MIVMDQLRIHLGKVTGGNRVRIKLGLNDSDFKWQWVQIEKFDTV